MPRLTDLDAVRRILHRDRIWSAFTLADLTPGYREHAEWRGDGDTVWLIYRAFEPPLLVPAGEPAALAALLDEVAHEPAFYLSVHESLLEPLAERGYAFERRRLMYRMALDADSYEACRTVETRRLTSAHRGAVEALYEEGRPRGEHPEFFLPAMLDIGVYEGVWDGDELVAAGGTHVFAPSEGVAALGNVYVRRDCRGSGLGAAVTTAVVDRIRAAGVPTIVLNVVATNAAACRTYRRLGFRIHCEFVEAVARKSC